MVTPYENELSTTRKCDLTVTPARVIMPSFPPEHPQNMALTIRVLQHEFTIDREYSEGHRLTEAEAAAMNQLLVENIRTNIYSWVVREAQGKAVLSPAQRFDLSARINEYADKYQFKSRTRQKPNPLESTVRELAWQHAELWGNKLGYSTESDEVREKYMELRTSREIYAQAKELIQQRQAVASKALEGLVI